MRKVSAACILSILILLVFSLNNAFSAEKKSGRKKKTIFKYEKEALKNPNICPVCGKSWNIKGEKNPHEECLKKLMPNLHSIRCGSCGMSLLVKRKTVNFKTEEMDKDLCPHKPGTSKAFSEYIVCPKCGFSGTEIQHRKGLTPSQRQWVLTSLKARTQKKINEILHRNLSKLEMKDKNDLYKIFSGKYSVAPEAVKAKGEEIIEGSVPETIRCENALLFAEKFYPADKFLLARLSWLAAWAYRREVASPMNESMLIRPMKRIGRVLANEFPVSPSPEERVNFLVKIYKDKQKYPFVQRQVMLIMMGGDYQRLGFTKWAMDCFNACKAACDSQALRIEEEAAGVNKKDMAAWREDMKKSLAIRIESALTELKYLQKASYYIKAGLKSFSSASKTIDINQIPAHVYLAGEFDRRCRNFAPAIVWLGAAEDMRLPAKQSGIEIWAEKQLGALRSTAGNISSSYAEKVTDLTLLASLGTEVQKYVEKASSVKETK
jgi:predicted RNA-binding Zn-ribbon protein involved in translation (DUF1610 family)